jgi:hypothetical protein
MDKKDLENLSVSELKKLKESITLFRLFAS